LSECDLPLRCGAGPKLELGRGLPIGFSLLSERTDLFIVRGEYEACPGPPFVPGSEFAGVVIKTAEELQPTGEPTGVLSCHWSTELE
jgi:hypothetical protein